MDAFFSGYWREFHVNISVQPPDWNLHSPTQHDTDARTISFTCEEFLPGPQGIIRSPAEITLPDRPPKEAEAALSACSWGKEWCVPFIPISLEIRNNRRKDLRMSTKQAERGHGFAYQHRWKWGVTGHWNSNMRHRGSFLLVKSSKILISTHEFIHLLIKMICIV